MIFSNLLASALLAASALVKATPLVPRDDDGWFPGFLKVLYDNDLTILKGIYEEFATTEQGRNLIDLLKCQEISLLAPVNSAFDPSNPSIGSDRFSVLSYNSIKGNIVSKKRQAPTQSRDVAPTLMQKPSFSKRAPDGQVQVVDTVASGNWKRSNNGTTLFIRSTTSSATLKAGITYKDLTIFPMDLVLATPTKVDDILCKPLVDSAPNGFTKLGTGLYQTGLMNTVNDGNGVTLFAPVDDAFQEYDGLPADDLAPILKNHVVSLNYYSPSFSTKPTVKAISGNKLKLEVEGTDTAIHTCVTLGGEQQI
ncbi:Fasciclin-domain-containing protein [Ceratobasidium sp. AG-I]|nr:Fasciclin-domain-containing protein [Ceratobasidium sp. AG-I]